MDNHVYGDTGILKKSELTVYEKEEVEYSEFVLKNKKSQNGEIIVTLFEFCDLSCKFCSQDHNNIIGINTILDKLEYIKTAIIRLDKMGRKTFGVHFMGGELFSDSLPDSIFDDYFNLATKLYIWCNENNYSLDMSFVSNLIHHKTFRVIELFDRFAKNKIPVGIMTSYDPSSRFNKSTIEVFYENTLLYKDLIYVVNVVLTAPNIKKFLDNDIKYFDYLYNNFPIYFDYYTPEQNSHINAPTDVNLRDMFIFLTNAYPKVMPISGYITNKENRMACQNTYNILPDGSTGHCIALLGGNYKGKATRTVGEMEAKFLKDYDCLNCQHFSRCGLGCFQHHYLMTERRTIEECWLSQVYDYMDAKNENTST